MIAEKTLHATFAGSAPWRYGRELQYQIVKKTREALRDLFFMHIGDRWREADQQIMRPALDEFLRTGAGRFALVDGRAIDVRYGEGQELRAVDNAVLVGKIVLESTLAAE